MKATQISPHPDTACNCLSRYKFKKLRHCVTGGEPLNPEVLGQWRQQTGLELHEGYGQTEVVRLLAKAKASRSDQQRSPGTVSVVL